MIKKIQVKQIRFSELHRCDACSTGQKTALAETTARSRDILIECSSTATSRRGAPPGADRREGGALPRLRRLQQEPVPVPVRRRKGELLRGPRSKFLHFDLEAIIINDKRDK